ncbi:hypothetical protein HN51_043396, partial [Arachis hypogaea]
PLAVTPCPIRSSPLPIFFHRQRKKREKEWAQPHQQPAFSTRKEGIENETRICVHYLWSGVTILNLLFPISPLPFFIFLAGSSRALFLIR